MRSFAAAVLLASVLTAANGLAQTPALTGVVRDDSGAALPGVTVELRGDGAPAPAVTDRNGQYRFDSVRAGRYQLVFILINFGQSRREIEVRSGSGARIDTVLHLALNADVTVAGGRSFANLAEVENPAENLVGVAQSASQGAITAKQLAGRPLMREGEVLETVPGVIVTQHSGEGKANQYFLRGFNLDHGTDFATTVAGVPVNLPTHAHGQGYSDVNFVVPELVSRVEFSKGPYYAEQGDFATAGSSRISYVDALGHAMAHVTFGGDGFGRALLAGSPRVGAGHLLAALEVEHNDGPWTRPDGFRKVNGVVRYSQGNSVDGFSLTAMGYRGDWDSTDQVPQRAIADGRITRFDAVDTTDGGHSYRYSLAADWQRTSGNASTRLIAYGLGYDLGLFSNFTYNLTDPIRGDQIEQTDHRFVAGAAISRRQARRWRGRLVQTTIGAELRNDDIANVGLYHTRSRARLETVSEAAVLETSGGLFAQEEVEWTPWLRTTAGLRADASRFRVGARDPANSGVASAALVNPKASVTIGPWKGTEIYLNSGSGFHSNDARGTTISRDPDGNATNRVTPLVRAWGSEIGVRTVAVPHLQSTVSLWMLRLASELVFSGDAGTTEASGPSVRRGLEFANYYRATNWLVFDADLSWSRSRFTQVDAARSYVPEAVGVVASGGATVDSGRRVFGSLRWRYFGPRALVEDNSVRSSATSLANLQAGVHVGKSARVAIDVFNVFNATASDIDYWYVSRLPGEPADGIVGLHTHPALPRTARVSFVVGF